MTQSSRDETLRRLASILHAHFGVEVVRVTEAATFRGTFAMDSSDIVDLMAFLEDEFKVRKELETYDDVHTVGGLVSYLEEQMAKKEKA